LSGCASTKPPRPKLTMTSQMFECRAQPDVPGENESDAVLAAYMVRLVLAHEDCEAQLGTVRNHLEINGVHVTEDPVLDTFEEPHKIFGLF